MRSISPSENPPVTAAGLASVVMGLMAAFGEFTDAQVAAVGSAVALIAAYVAQRFTTPKENR